MKKTKFIGAIIVVLLFTNGVNAVNPSKENVESPSSMMVEKLSKDLILNDSQKVAIAKKAQTFTDKMKIASKITNREELVLVKKEIYSEYKFALDSILTYKQQEQLSIKQNEREKAFVKVNETKK